MGDIGADASESFPGSDKDKVTVLVTGYGVLIAPITMVDNRGALLTWTAIQKQPGQCVPSDRDLSSSIHYAPAQEADGLRRCLIERN